jgi:hypothetical protein
MKRSAAILAVLALVAVPLAGCGGDEEVTSGQALTGNPEEPGKSVESEALYLELGDLEYQVQISRQLNPADVEDRAYLTGVPESLAEVGNNETWFGVFVRVENRHDEAHEAAESFELHDTQDNVFQPVPIAETNPFAYAGGTVPGKGLLPPLQSVGQLNESIAGLLVLFKVPNASLENRPLEFIVKNPQAPRQTGSIALDV